jgi:heme-degrading monooxygenase HmoA
MFARVTWTQAAAGQQIEVDKLAAFFRERVIPSMQTRPGFLGGVALVNREKGEATSVTYWESAEAMAGSEGIGAAGRAEAVQTLGVAITDVDRFEMLLQERAGPVQVGTFVRSNDVPASPGRIDAALAWMRDSAAPRVKSASGFRALLVFGNRLTGRLLISSVWDTAEDRQASELVLSGLRSQLGEVAQAQADIRIELYEGVVAEVSQTAQQATAAAASAR